MKKIKALAILALVCWCLYAIRLEAGDWGLSDNTAYLWGGQYNGSTVNALWWTVVLWAIPAMLLAVVIRTLIRR